MKYLRFLTIILFLLAIAFTACDSDDEGGTQPPPFDSTDTLFDSADTPGDSVSITVGSEIINMIYANNQTNITFPFSQTSITIPFSPIDITAVDNEKGTLTRKFFMSQTEVTNALMVTVLQWAYDNGKFSTTAEDPNGLDAATVKHGGQQLLYLDGMFGRINYSGGSFTVDSGYEDHPVVNVSWYGAIMYCNWLTEMRDGNTENVVYTGIDTTWVDTETVENADRTGYRLPSSEEWEYAARYIGTTAPSVEPLASDYIARNVNSGHTELTEGYFWTPAAYPSGGTDGGYTGTYATDYLHFNPYGWFGDNIEPNGNTTSLQPVAQKTANKLGIYDMSGNVWEWCFTASVSYRVQRGGCWASWPAIFLQVGYCYFDDPSSVSSGTGFRFVRTR